MEDTLTAIFFILPVILVAFIIRWIRILKINSEIQIKQNDKIIELLKKNQS